MNLTIKNKIRWSLLALVSALVINGIITIFLINNISKRSVYISEVIYPSAQACYDFRKMMVESQMYSTNWVFLRSNQESRDLLKNIQDTGFPDMKHRFGLLSQKWKDENMKDSLTLVLAGFGELLAVEKNIMTSLQKFSDYDDPVMKFNAESILENEALPRTSALRAQLETIITYAQQAKEQEQNRLDKDANLLRLLVTLLAVIVIVIGLLLSAYLSRIILKPISQIHKIIILLGKGIIKQVEYKPTGDEIGEMILSVNNLSEKLLATASFAHEVGVRNFSTHYEPLSEEDILGKSLIAMRDNLKNSEKELIESNYQKETLFNNMDEIFFSVDNAENKLLQISPACEEVYGHSREDFFENPNLWYEIVIAEDKRVIDENYPKIMAGESITIEYRILHKGGFIRWVETKVTPTLDNNKRLARMDGITADISKRKEAEANLITNLAELKKRNSELDEFVYSTSHDLRAPLRSILGVVELSEDMTTDAFMLKHLAMIKASTKRLDGFILDILDYSRNSRVEIKKEEINFKEILDDISGNLKYMGNNNRQVDIRVSIKNGVCFKSDKTRLAVILNNLVSNSIRYQNPKAEHPYVAIDVDLSESEAKIAVNDNGIGIPKDKHQKIFEMFYRVASNSVGSGLGLYIVKETIDKLNGNIAVDSEPEIGTTFKIYIPNNN